MTPYRFLTALNKPIDVEKMQPDKGWDYNPGADLTKGVQKALDSKRGKVSGVLLSALDDKNNRYAQPIMQSISLSDNDKQLLTDVGRSLSNTRSEWFPVGFEGFVLDKSLNGFAKSPDGKTIHLASNDSQIQGFIPVQQAASALKKIANNQPLVFDEEYAIEIIWHEILHIRTPNITRATDVMETVTQFIARHTYHELLDVLGGIKPVHFDGVLQFGYGYRTNVENFRYALKRLQIDEAEFAKELYMIYLQSGDDVRSKTASLMGEYSDKSAKRNSKILGELTREPSDFKRVIEKILARY